MLCYRDRIYCPFHLRCKAGDFCARSLTDSVVKDAADFGLPISQFAEEPNCFDPKENEDDAGISTDE